MKRIPTFLLKQNQTVSNVFEERPRHVIPMNVIKIKTIISTQKLLYRIEFCEDRISELSFM